MRNLFRYVTNALVVIALALCGLGAAIQWPHYTIAFFALSACGAYAFLVLRRR
jgi:predicted small lipoprotein YifL